MPDAACLACHFEARPEASFIVGYLAGGTDMATHAHHGSGGRAFCERHHKLLASAAIQYAEMLMTTADARPSLSSSVATEETKR